LLCCDEIVTLYNVLISSTVEPGLSGHLFVTSTDPVFNRLVTSPPIAKSKSKTTTVKSESKSESGWNEKVQESKF